MKHEWAKIRESEVINGKLGTPIIWVAHRLFSKIKLWKQIEEMNAATAWDIA